MTSAGQPQLAADQKNTWKAEQKTSPSSGELSRGARACEAPSKPQGQKVSQKSSACDFLVARQASNHRSGGYEGQTVDQLR